MHKTAIFIIYQIFMLLDARVDKYKSNPVLVEDQNKSRKWRKWIDTWIDDFRQRIVCCELKEFRSWSSRFYEIQFQSLVEADGLLDPCERGSCSRNNRLRFRHSRHAIEISNGHRILSHGFRRDDLEVSASHSNQNVP